MTEITTAKPRIYRLLDIKPSSWKMILLILPPVYAIWLLAIGKRLLEKQNKPDKTFTFFATMTIACFIFAYVITPILMLPPMLKRQTAQQDND